MIRILKICAVFLLSAFCGCVNDTSKTGLQTSNEKPKTQALEEFERNIESAKAIGDSGIFFSDEKTKAKASEDFQKNLENKNPTTTQTIPKHNATSSTSSGISIPDKPEVCRICWGTKTENCGRCVNGKVRQQVQREKYNPYTERNDIYYEDEYVNCYEYGCNNGQVKCSVCNGTGYRN